MSKAIIVAKERKNIEMARITNNVDRASTDFCTAADTKFDPAKPVASKGLSSRQDADLLIKNGPNMLSPSHKRHPILMFLDELRDLLNLMLPISGIACHVIYAIDPIANFSNVYIGAILIVVAFANACVTFYQLQKSQSILESFMVT